VKQPSCELSNMGSIVYL